jgi:hypothetical protein
MAHLLRHAQLASCAGWPCAAVEQWNIGTLAGLIHNYRHTYTLPYRHPHIHTSKHSYAHTFSAESILLPQPIRALSGVVCFACQPLAALLRYTKAFNSRTPTSYHTEYCGGKPISLICLSAALSSRSSMRRFTVSKRTIAFSLLSMSEPRRLWHSSNTNLWPLVVVMRTA